MQSRRGRIMQALSSISDPRPATSAQQELSRPAPHSSLDQENIPASSAPSQPTEESTPTSRPIIRPSRGRVMAALSLMRGGDTNSSATREQQSASTSSDNKPIDQRHVPSPDSSTGSGQRSKVPLSRQGSELSSASVISQQFGQVETFQWKATLEKRPSQLGQPIKLATNYLNFDVRDGCSVEEYHVDFTPNIDSIKLRFKILREPVITEVIGSVMHWTGSNLFLPKKLKDNPSTFESKHPVSGETVTVRISYVKRPPCAELIPFYNSLMRKAMLSLKMVLINRNYYSNVGKMTISEHQIEVWPGWITSIEQLDGGIKLSVDASFRILRMQTAYDMMCAIRNRAGNLKTDIEAALIGTTVLTKYNNKAYRIDDICFDKKPSDTFTFSRPNQVEQTTTYADYLKNNWNVTIRDMNQPLLLHRPKFKKDNHVETICLVPEVCLLTGLTEEMRTNFTLMKAVADVTRVKPDIREEKLCEFLTELNTNEKAKKVFEDWNLKLADKSEIYDGRKIDNLKIMSANKREITVPDNADWTRQVTNGPVYQSVDVMNWVLIYCDRDTQTAQNFLQMLRTVTNELRIKLNAPRQIKLPGEQTKNYITEIKQNVTPADQLVVILTPGRSQREDRYSACKRLLSCDLPVPSQFIRCGTISNANKLKSIVQKVAIQVLCKVGGQPWAMKFPMRSFMIIGIDVYHDTLDKKRSCVAFVASTNETASQWWSRVFYQHTFEEICVKLKQTVIEALKKFHSINGFIPSRIIVFRDGVGFGQLDHVLRLEISQFMDGINFFIRDFQPDSSPPTVSYIIVQKRINAKLMLKTPRSTENPRPGSYLDHSITHPEYNDFYLVSQHVNQGTVSPTRFIVLTETGSLKVENHCKLAYMLCHMYWNWTGTIKVPAPCQYAHKLAYLAGQNLQNVPSPRLDHLLYYL